MKRVLWNDGWRLQKGGTFFDAFGGGEEKGEPVTLPYDPLIHMPRQKDAKNGPSTGFYDGDTYIFIKNFTLDDALWGMPVYLDFEGVMGVAMVYLNGQFVAKNQNGYTEFSVFLNPYLRWDRPNELKVVSKTGMQQISRWYAGAGIYRDVYLRSCEADGFIEGDGVRVTTESVADGEAILRVETEVCSFAAKGMLRTMLLETELVDESGKIVGCDRVPVSLLPEKPCTVRQRMLVEGPQFWSVDAPHLYTVRSRLTEGEHLLDQNESRFGIRTLTIDARHGLRLNGETIKLRGGCFHHDSGLLGAATYREYEERRVRILKAAGFNAIRSSHNLIARPLLDACDRYGMLVMDEGFDCWNTGKTDHDYALYFQEHWQDVLRQMVRKDYNHPCVFTYSIGNEIPDVGAADGWLQGRAMADYLRSLDPTRPVSNCINAMFAAMDQMGQVIEDVLGKDVVQKNQESEINSMMMAFATRMDDIISHPLVTARIEESYAAVDLAGYNYMDARYRADHERYPNRVIVGSETNALRIAENWQLILDCPHVIGDFCWTAMDHIGEAELSAREDGTFAAYCGDIGLTGERKAKSYYRETVWGLRDRPAIFVGRPEKFGKDEMTGNWGWTDAIASWTLPGAEGRPVQVSVYADADEVALYLNGELLEKKKTGTPHPYMALFAVDYQPGTLTAVAYRNGEEVSRETLTTAGAAKRLQLSVEPDTEQLLFVHIDVTDTDGKLVSSENPKVTLSVEGGELLGFGSSSVSGYENYYDTTRTPKDGRLLAIIRRGSAPVTVTATAEGLEAGRLSL